MKISDLKKRLEEIPDDQIVSAQEQLNALCEQYGIKKWSIRSGASRWRELGLRIVGVPLDDTYAELKMGRPSNWGDENTPKDIVETIDIARLFEFEVDDSEKERKLKNNELFELIVKQYNIKPFITKDTNKEISAIKRVEVLWNNHKKKFLADIAAEFEEYKKNYKD